MTLLVIICPGCKEKFVVEKEGKKAYLSLHKSNGCSMAGQYVPISSLKVLEKIQARRR
jgi:hypothetical protein